MYIVIYNVYKYFLFVMFLFDKVIFFIFKKIEYLKKKLLCD